MQTKYSFIAICAAALLAGCSVGNALTPYKLQIPQGNEITADQVAQLKQGMTRQQVRYVLGTPLLADAFHGNRWDYVYSEAKGGTMHLERKFTLEFDGDKLKSWSGDTLPASRLIKLGDMASAPIALEDPVAANAAVSGNPIAQVASDSASATKK